MLVKIIKMYNNYHKKCNWVNKYFNCNNWNINWLQWQLTKLIDTHKFLIRFLLYIYKILNWNKLFFQCRCYWDFFRHCFFVNVFFFFFLICSYQFLTWHKYVTFYQQSAFFHFFSRQTFSFECSFKWLLVFNVNIS